MTMQEQDLYGSSRLGTISNPTALSTTPQYLDHLGSGTLFTFTRGKKLFELTNHLGNVLATVSDKKFGTPVTGIPSQIAYYTADVESAQDYYPFGMEMPGRQYNATYPYSFNGKRDDKDAEYGWNDYDMREYDRRRAQFISLDPNSKKNPEESNYTFVSNNPVIYNDKQGRDKIYTVTTIAKNGSKTILTIRDKSQFDYFMTANYGSLPTFNKRDIYESITIDLRADVSKGEKVISTTTSYSSQNYHSNLAEYLGLQSLNDKISGNQSKLEVIGIDLLGSNTDGNQEDKMKLPKAAPGSEIMDIEGLINALDIREGLSATDFLKDGSKLKKILESAERITEAAEKLKQAQENKEKSKIEPPSKNRRVKYFWDRTPAENMKGAPQGEGDASDKIGPDTLFYDKP